MYRSTKKKFVRRIGVSTAVALSVAATTVGIANAATTTSRSAAHAKALHPSAWRVVPFTSPPANAAVGVVTALTSTSVTVSDRLGTSAVYAIDSATTVTNEGRSASVSDLKVGEHVVITLASSATVTASSIEIDPDHGPGPRHGRFGGPGGVVTALTGTSITVKDRSGSSSTYTYGAATTVTKERAGATTADLKVGEMVMLRVGASDATAAVSIDIEQPIVIGQVTSVSGDSIIVSGRRGVTSTVVVSSATTYSKNGSTVDLSAVSVGSTIFAQGSFESNGTTLDATTIGIGLRTPDGVGHAGPHGPEGGPAGPGMGR